ncbi:single-stranded DNA-binding protein [Gehongia tenuis]|jgi:single-strand DNA-binding protein|uniref:Single-stranded DNA-binding protein n=1 Tax=Gehongia tenuis TaxID=2763655 RepID=A0A926D650_9FIRM|nr:single-stranded DNA-binding protein [Gehongia tenuis]MBC8532047.1 single-stranded DNA-binding protein [Gehongia tenuis]
MNKAIIVGNLTRDPELRATGSGISVCSFTVAVNRRFKDQNGETQADFIPVVVWRQQGENCAKYLSKGSKVAVCGAIQVRSYDAQDGSKRYATEIVADEVQFLNSRGEGAAPQPRQERPAPKAPASMQFDDDLHPVEDDDLPF